MTVAYDRDLWMRFVQALCSGIAFEEACRRIGLSVSGARARWVSLGGMSMVAGRQDGLPVPSTYDPDTRTAVPVLDEDRPRVLSLGERCLIEMRLYDKRRPSAIARELGRAVSSITREIKAGRDERERYRAQYAHTAATARRARPKQFKLATNARLRQWVTGRLDDGWSPRLIALVLPSVFPDDESMRISHETIYQCLYVQGRAGLRADLYKQLSLKRPKRKPRQRSQTRGRPYREALKISERPAEVADRAVPGHWEGDLIVGSDGRSAIGTLVERTSRFTVLLHLPDGHTADQVARAMIAEMNTLPAHLHRSITWDRGTELANYRDIMLDLKTPVYFCDPRSPWQRGTNENTNRLLRHWFTKGTRLDHWSHGDLKRIQDTLNSRPRPTLNLKTPAQALAQHLTEVA